MGSPVAVFILVGDQPWASAMVESVGRVTGYPVVQMSDLNTPEVDGVDEVVRIPMRVPLMPYRIKHLALSPYREWVSFDTDIIVKKPLADVWERPFDVALTQRMEYKCLDPEGVDIAPFMPFNTGVMFSREPAFWQECYEWLRRQTDAKQHWWGDQLAVAEVAARKRYHVLSLPGPVFNWTPNKEHDTSDQARVWHYKGPQRKSWMTGEHVEHHATNRICNGR